MADQIKHGSQQIVASNSSIDVSALPDVSGLTAAVHTSNNTQLVSFEVDTKGRILASSNSQINVTGVTFGEVNAAGAGTLAHAPNQKIYISGSAPSSDSIGNNGDIWYQTLT